MPKRLDIRTILVIGSGPIVIGQACEFDYSGTQAIKALKEEGYRVVLVNSNPATIMTDPTFADATYIEPITSDFIEKIIQREKPDVILPTIGGQTALNAAIDLEEKGILQKYGVKLIGASVEAIKKAEDREKFKNIVADCGLESAKSTTVYTMEEAEAARDEIGFPLIIRPSRTLGGSGGAIVENLSEFYDKVQWGFDCSPIGEILIEESLLGWKEFELELMRDSNDNAVIVCSIENLDPMGLHTGDSITVAPAQTLTDKEYQVMRDSALALMSAIGVDTGGSNVQFSVCPKTGKQVVIELNPRVSRSSALASKATGFPIAKIAAKLAVGYALDELINDITKKTPACFEPSIDYVVVKIPRFTFEKFKGADRSLGTQMKSVGEVMAIGRTFPEAMQKACRSLEEGKSGLLGGAYEKKDNLLDVLREAKKLSPDRPYLMARALQLGATPEQVYQVTAYDTWFTNQILKIVSVEKEISAAKNLLNIDDALFRKAKQRGTSDERMAKLLSVSEREIRDDRLRRGIRPVFKKVDTCAAEFQSDTPYLYSTYDEEMDLVAESKKKKIMILGGGPNRIGQGIEFDYCCVHASFALREAGYETIMVNCNPETVSTDYDTSDRLYFEPLTFEDVLEVVNREKPDGVIVQYGGQTPLKLANALEMAGVPIIGTSPQSIEKVEDRKLFSALLDKLKLNQAPSGTATNLEEALVVAERIGFPLLVRPSFVLGGRAMAIIHSVEELAAYIHESVLVSNERPVLLDRFLDSAIEVDVDAVCDGRITVIAGIIEHIERAGVHSGDSAFLLPSQHLSKKVLSEIERMTKVLASECDVCGLMNVQYAVTGSKVWVLEVNPRASRSVPFISKVMGIPWAKVAARVMAGESLEELSKEGAYGDLLQYQDYQKAVSKIKYVAVKEAVFPFVKFRGIDTLLGPEMKSTGEVMGIDDTTGASFYKAQVGAGVRLPLKGTVFISVRDSDKEAVIPIAKKLSKLGFDIIATEGTQKFLSEQGIGAKQINKVREGSPHIVDALERDQINLIINTPEGTGTLLDSQSIRSTSVAKSLPLYTTIAAAHAVVEAIEVLRKGDLLEVKSMQEYLAL